MEKAKLELKNLSKKFGKTVAIDDVSFKVNNKEFFVIFGPAGAGKTTLLKLIAGIAVPDSGKVVIDGKIVNNREPCERNIAMVFENYALYPHMNVFENIAFPLRSPKIRMKSSQIEQRVRQVARTLKIDHLLSRPIQALSNGQRQRTALGRALVRNPEVFLMDEPLSHLDAKLRNMMRTELKLVQNELNTTTIYVTHDYLEALSLGDRIMVLNEGRVMEIGTPDEIYRRPSNVTVAKGFGDPEINIMNAQLENNGADGLSAFLLSGQPGIKVASDVVAELKSTYREKGILVGFRPADVKITSSSEQALRGRVYSYEPIGARAVLVIEVESKKLVRALVDSDKQFSVDQNVHFSIDPRDVIYFEKNSGRFIARSMLGNESKGG